MIVSDAAKELDANDGQPITIAVDAATLRFALWRAGDAWWAAGHHHQHGLVLERRRLPIDEVRLGRVNDLEPYLARSLSDSSQQRITNRSVGRWRCV
jgi:hypothetical protein